MSEQNKSDARQSVVSLAWPRESTAAPGTVLFRNMVFDPERRTLVRGTEEQTLTPRLAAVLTHLLDARHRTVSRAELLRVHWSGEAVSAAVVPNAIAGLRRVFGQGAAEQAPLRTVRGRGYRFTGPVRLGPRLTQERFVGRVQARRVGDGLVARARMGHGCMMVVQGPPGIGKSRLLEEVLAGAQAQGVQWLAVRCKERSHKTPFGALRAAAHGRGDARQSSALHTALLRAPDLSESVGGGSGAAWHSLTESARFEMCDRLAAAVLPPVGCPLHVVTVEDLQWADEATSQWLEILALLAPNHRLFVAVCWGTESVAGTSEPPSGLRKLLRASDLVRVDLQGLQSEATEDLVRSLGPTAVDVATEPEILRLSQGNPMVIEALCSTELPAAAQSPFAQVLPEAALQPALDRLDRLEQGAVNVLALAATFGQQVALRDLVDLSGQPLDTVVDDVEQAARAGMVAQAGAGAFRFASRIAFEACYRRIGAGTRARLHDAAADILQRRSGAFDATASRWVVLHRLRALPYGDVGSAIRDVNAWVRQALTGFGSQDEATGLSVWALSAIPDGTQDLDRPRAMLLLDTALLAISEGQLAEATRLARALLDGAKFVRQPRVFAAAFALLHHLAERGDTTAARTVLGVRGQLPDLAHGDEGVVALLADCGLAHDGGQIAPIAGPARVSAPVQWQSHAESLWVQQDVWLALAEDAGLRRRHTCELSEVDHAAGSWIRSHSARGTSAVGSATGEMCDPTSAAGRVFSASREVIALRDECRARLGFGDRACATEVMGLFGAPGDGVVDPTGASVLRAQLMALRCDWDGLQVWLHRVQCRAQLDPWLAAARSALAALAVGAARSEAIELASDARWAALYSEVAAGNGPAATRLIERASAERARWLGDWRSLPALCSLVDRVVLDGLADRDLCRALLALLAPFCGRVVVDRCLSVTGAVDFFVARLHRTLGAPERAIEALREADAIHIGLSAPLLQWRAAAERVLVAQCSSEREELAKRWHALDSRLFSAAGNRPFGVGEMTGLSVLRD